MTDLTPPVAYRSQRGTVARHRNRPDLAFPRFVRRTVFRTLWAVLTLFLVGLAVVIVQFVRVTG